MAEAKLKLAVRELYKGQSRRGHVFRYGLISFDFLVIGFFLATTPLEPTRNVLAVDFVIGCIILLDFLARLWIARDRLDLIFRLQTLGDLLVLFALLAAPLFAEQLAFLRVLRALRLLHIYHMLRDLRREAFYLRYEQVIVSAVNLLVFLVVTTALVYVLEVEGNPEIETYLDALYFTVATMTTTGFGDIILGGQLGRLLAILILVIGVALFLRLAQSVLLPAKVYLPCPNCGFEQHEQDALHCKRCGQALKEEAEEE